MSRHDEPTNNVPLSGAEIAGFMNWRGPGAYTAHAERRVVRLIAVAGGHPAALAELRARLAAGALQFERAANPGLSPDAAAWLADGERGVSSNTMFEYLTGVKATRGWGRSHPHDPGDFRRCRLLLERVPDLVPLLPRMAEVSPVWAALVAGWDSLCATMDAECPHWRTGRGGSAPKTYEMMRAIRKEAGDA